MTPKKTIAFYDFGDAEELASAIKTLLAELGGTEIVYIASNGFVHTGRLYLIQETLTDGSFVYNMEIGAE